MQNSKQICSDLLKAQALCQVQDAFELANAVIDAYQNPEHCQQQVSNASRVMIENQGALHRHLQMIDTIPDFVSL